MQILLRACFCVLVLTSSRLYAQESCQWSSWQDFARDLSQGSPELKSIEAEGEYRSTLEATARLKPSSMLNTQFIAGEDPGTSSEFEGSYLWTLESAAKSDARVAAARAGSHSVASRLEDSRARQLLTIALTQQGLKQLEARREILLETKETYTKIIQRYRRIPSRGPEQDTSLAVIEIAKGETDLRLHALDVEESEKLFGLAALSGCDSVSLPIKSLAKTKAPSWKEEETPETSSAMARLETEAKSIELEAEAEIQGFSPDLSIGPVVILGREESKDRFELGIAASLPISGGRTALLSDSKASERRARQSRVELEKKRLRIEREAWKSQYHRATAAMKTGLSNEEIARSHQKFEALFRSERISAALVIESHRQMLEHVIAYSELEAKATEAFWNLRYLDGRLSWRDL